MKTLFHPNMRDTSVEVDEAVVDAFVAQGWRKTPKNFDAAPADSKTTSTTNSSASGEDKNKEVN